MPQIKLSTQHLGKSSHGYLPEYLVNMRAQLRDNGHLSLVSVAGVTQFATIGATSQPVAGLFQMDGILDNDAVVVMPNAVFRVNESGVATSIGAISVVDRVRIAASLTQIVVVSGGNAYEVLSSGVTQITDVDLGEISDVVYAAGLFVFVEKDSDRVKWSEVLDAKTIRAESFATAEGRPDRLRGLANLGEDLVLFGYETTEIWGKTGDINAPFQVRSGSLNSTGCASRDSIVEIGSDNTANFVSFLGNDRIVRLLSGAGAEKISSAALNEELQTLANADLEAVYGFSWAEDGYWFLCYQLPNTTWVYDVSNQVWHTRADILGNPWSVGTSCEAWGQTVFGNSVVNKIGLNDIDSRSVFDERFGKTFTAIFPNEMGRSAINSVSLKVALGLNDDVGVERFIWVRWSDDRGNNWASWRRKSLGVQGSYKSSVSWSPCGSTVNAGRVFQFEMRDPYNFTVNAAFVNEVAV